MWTSELRRISSRKSETGKVVVFPASILSSTLCQRGTSDAYERLDAYVRGKPCPNQNCNDALYHLALIQDETKTRRWHCFACGNWRVSTSA
jgi:hypothetical protein